MSESFKVEVGVRQGCVMSPWLFSIYSNTSLNVWVRYHVVVDITSLWQVIARHSSSYDFTRGVGQSTGDGVARD